MVTLANAGSAVKHLIRSGAHCSSTIRLSDCRSERLEYGGRLEYARICRTSSLRIETRTLSE